MNTLQGVIYCYRLNKQALNLQQTLKANIYAINKRIAPQRFLYGVITHEGPKLNNSLGKVILQLDMVE